MSYNLLTDDMLVKLLKASDNEAFRVIYERFWKSLYTKAYIKLRSADLAEELTQSLFVSIWENRSVSNIDNLSFYLHAAIKYKIINYIQSRYAKQRAVESENFELISDNATENTILLRDLHIAIEKAIQLLPSKTREVFKLSRFESFSVREIARQMDISEKAVEYHITQSLKLLRFQLKDYMVFSLLVFILQV
jgi:RNA polymerase sigma-70 factor (ECF subfamily)